VGDGTAQVESLNHLLLITQGLSVKDIYSSCGSPLGISSSVALKALSKGSFFSLLLQKRKTRDLYSRVSLKVAAQLAAELDQKADLMLQVSSSARSPQFSRVLLSLWLIALLINFFCQITHVKDGNILLSSNMISGYESYHALNYKTSN